MSAAADADKQQQRPPRLSQALIDALDSVLGSGGADEERDADDVDDDDALSETIAEVGRQLSDAASSLGYVINAAAAADQRQQHNNGAAAALPLRPHCYSCYPSHYVRRHVTHETDEFVFGFDMWARPLVIVTPRRHYHEIIDMDDAMQGRMFRAIRRWLAANDICDHQTQLHFNAGSWQTHDHFHIKLRINEERYYAMRERHFAAVNGGAGAFPHRRRSHYAPPAASPQQRRSSPPWVVCRRRRPSPNWRPPPPPAPIATTTTSSPAAPWRPRWATAWATQDDGDRSHDRVRCEAATPGAEREIRPPSPGGSDGGNANKAADKA